MNRLIQLTDVSAGYDREIVLRDVNLSVYDHDFIGVIGPNGAGKPR
jgi:zinc transport system ATP-binding protein